jgi:chromosome segregation ATPase
MEKTVQNFDYLVRRHAKALGLFAKVTNKLKKLEAKISAIIAKSAQSIEEANKHIEDEKKNLEFLNAHLTKTQESRKSVEQFLPSTPDTSRIF